MALASHMATNIQRARSMNSIHDNNIGVHAMMATKEASDTIYVAVAKDVKDSKNVKWAIQNSGGKRICVIHVHVPANMILMMGAKFPASALSEHEVQAHRKIEIQEMHKTLDAYLDICQRMGVRAEKLHIAPILNFFGVIKVSLQSPDRGMDDNIVYEQLEEAMAEAEKARLNAYQESVRRRKAEKDAINATRKFKDTKILFEKEVEQRKVLEEALKKAKEEIDNMRIEINKVNEELKLALDHKMQGDNALREVEELRRKISEASSRTHSLQLSLLEFSFSEIEEATCNSDPSLMIGEGGYGIVFKGILRHTEVAIKKLNPNSSQGASEFQQEVEVLIKLRHPNLITLIGANHESKTLVYEYLPNGSLEDRLNCKDNSPPLPWKTRIRIATELCSALIFLHSNKPHGIVHCDLKPSNILLDANLVTKLSDFGICRVLSCREDSSNYNSTKFWNTRFPKGTFTYMDPEFLCTGELTSKSDVYSFGIVLLRLLTGRQALGIRNEVLYALNDGEMESLLDPLAGDWPIVKGEKLVWLALKCCDLNRKNRPELSLDVWRLLESMRGFL